MVGNFPFGKGPLEIPLKLRLHLHEPLVELVGDDAQESVIGEDIHWRFHNTTEVIYETRMERRRSDGTFGGQLLVSVDNSTHREIVRREFDPDPVAGEDPDVI